MSLKIINKMQTDSTSSQEISICKNHPDIPSGYFLSDQPWIKYCKQCALNVALCGRKIEKQLTPHEFDRKMQISSIVSEMKNSIEQIQSSSDYYKKLTDILEEVAGPLNNHIKDVDNALKELTSAKQRLEAIYIQEVSQKIHQFFEKQSKISFLSLQVKKQLESIESNYGNLIEMSDQSDFAASKEKWNGVLATYRKEQLKQEEYSECKGRIAKSIEEFYNQLEKISQFNIDIKLDKTWHRGESSSDDFDITLTPADGNSLSSSVNFDLKLGQKTRCPLRLKTNKKISTERDSINTSKIATRRQSYIGIENQHDTSTKRTAVWQ